MYVDLLLAHQFDRVIVYIAALIANKKLLCSHHTAKAFGVPAGDDRFEC